MNALSTDKAMVLAVNGTDKGCGTIELTGCWNKFERI